MAQKLLRNPLVNPNVNRLPGAQFIVGSTAHKNEAIWLLGHVLNRSVKSQVEELQRMLLRKD